MNTVHLPSHCDRAAALALYPELLEAMGAKATPIDASKVERLGQPMLQLLVSAATSGSGIALRDPTPQFLDAIRMAGLGELLADGADT